MKATRYRNPSLRQLADQQVKLAPVTERVARVNRAEELLGRLEPEKKYRYQDLYSEITSQDSAGGRKTMIAGKDAIHDLQLFVEDVSASAGVRAEKAGEKVLTVEDLSKKFRVSPKTVDRWRRRGLVARKFLIGGRNRVGFLSSSVDRFVSLHTSEVARGERFSQMTDQERGEILERARRLAMQGATLTEVSKRLSKKLDRSREAIRYTIRSHDEDHPDAAVFRGTAGALSYEKKKEIYTRFRRGVPVEQLSREYFRTKNSIYRIVSEVRARLLFEQPIDYIDSTEFHTENADKVILGPPPAGVTSRDERKVSRVKAPAGLPPYLASLYSIPLLTRGDEQYYFRKMNYLKFKAAGIRSRIDEQHPRTKDLEVVEQLIGEATEIKNFLIRSNLRLVVSIAKRYLSPTSNFFEMVSDGNMSLIRAIEKFDYAKGNKFSTYATWAIMKNYARSIPAEHTQHDRYRTGTDEVFQFSRDERANPYQEELDHHKQQEVIVSILDQLDDREKSIIVQRYGLKQGSEPMTLEEVGQSLGVTKERIRQLEARALKKARKIVHEDKLDIPGL